MDTSSIQFESEKEISLDELKENSFVVLTTEDKHAINTYTGIISYVDKKNIGFKRASCVNVYKNTSSAHISNMKTHFSISKEWVTKVVASKMYISKY